MLSKIWPIILVPTDRHNRLTVKPRIEAPDETLALYDSIDASVQKNG